MTPEKMNQAFAKCLEPLARHYDDQPPAELPEKLKKSTRRTHFADGFHPHDAIRHLKWMCLRGIALVAEHRFDKANRWLGFIQGALWMTGFCSIDEMKEWNRPDEVEVPIAAKRLHVELRQVAPPGGCVLEGCGNPRMSGSNLCEQHNQLLRGGTT